jgi:hypothetical protein
MTKEDFSEAFFLGVVFRIFPATFHAASAPFPPWPKLIIWIRRHVKIIDDIVSMPHTRD